ncbi:MAG: sigma 54-interacting transcriptional regulator [Thermodesulfobacteriota bacterium]
MDQLNQELQKTRDELGRVIRNRATFYEIMSDMIFLIRADHVIEDMNKSAISTFGDWRGRKCHDVMHGHDTPCNATCPVRLAMAGKLHEPLIEKKIGAIHVEYTYAPFEGYHGDKLVMVAMRDVSKRKQHELEIAEFNTNIERILQQKISDLNESEQTRNQLVREINILKKELSRAQKPDEMVGESKPIRELREMIYQVADTSATVLITGESGTGKELIADLIHKHSSLANKTYLKFNCAAVSESLLESDLFGYEKGSFTGAVNSRKGKFEIADGGTIFLDEIGDISPKMQASLLRVLQNGEVIRVGGNHPVKVNVRVVAATNADLLAKVEQGSFRKDLYYRLNVINLRLPPLRERKEDIIPLASHFIRKFRNAFKKEIEFVPDEVIDALLQHSWQGNIRELENAIQRAVLLSKNNTLSLTDLDLESHGDSTTTDGAGPLITPLMYQQPLKESIAELESRIIAGALRAHQANVQEVASRLEIGKTALYAKLKKHGISAKEFKNGSP